ncbi:MAG: hypothetical protein OIF34_04875, partial [Porticoccaceae bacterium]|nr:hypothetical protein [Porticoccaceae bacterium]
MYKPLNTIFSSALLLLLAPELALAQSMPLPKPRPGISVSTSVPVILSQPAQSTQPVAATSFNALTQAATFPQTFPVLPRTKPGLAPRQAATSVATPVTTQKPVASVALPQTTGFSSSIQAQRGSLKQALNALSKRKSKTALAIHKGMKRSLD